MDLKEKICKFYNEKKIHILKDELGNVATGTSYFEALKYLELRRVKKERGAPTSFF